MPRFLRRSHTHTHFKCLSLTRRVCVNVCVCVCVCAGGWRCVAHVPVVFMPGDSERQTGEKRDGGGARRVAAPSGRLLSLSSCCLKAGGSTAAPCQLLLQQKPPCMQNRLRLPSLLGRAHHHTTTPSFSSFLCFFPVYYKHLLIFCPSLGGSVRIQFNFKPSNARCWVIVTTRTNTMRNK